MHHIPLLAPIALLAAAISAPAFAGECAQGSQRQHIHVSDKRAANGFDYGMRAVPNSAVRDAPGYGWRYFSDPVALRAVVISPQGDYYFSRGKGLHWIAAEQSS